MNTRPSRDTSGQRSASCTTVVHIVDYNNVIILVYLEGFVIVCTGCCVLVPKYTTEQLFWKTKQKRTRLMRIVLPTVPHDMSSSSERIAYSTYAGHCSFILCSAWCLPIAL